MYNRQTGPRYGRQSRFFYLLSEPSARGEMRLTEAGTIHTAIRRRTDLRQFVKRNQHTIPVDAELVRYIQHDL